MSEAICKAGDVLEFTEIVPRSFELRTRPVRGLIVKIADLGFGCYSYRFLLFEKADSLKNTTLCWALEKSILAAAKRVGHIDISLLRFEECEEEKSATQKKNIFDALKDPKFVEFLNQYVDVKKLQDEIEALKKEVSDLRKENKDLSDRLGDEVSGKWDNWVESGGF